MIWTMIPLRLLPAASRCFIVFNPGVLFRFGYRSAFGLPSVALADQTGNRLTSRSAQDNRKHGGFCARTVGCNCRLAMFRIDGSDMAVCFRVRPTCTLVRHDWPWRKPAPPHDLCLDRSQCEMDAATQ